MREGEGWDGGYMLKERRLFGSFPETEAKGKIRPQEDNPQHKHSMIESGVSSGEVMDTIPSSWSSVLVVPCPAAAV